MIKVLIVDDQKVICEGLRVILNAAPNITVLGVAYDGYQALELVQSLQPDIVLMDLKMPKLNGVQTTLRLKDLAAAPPVLVLTTYHDDEWVLDAIQAGASGYLLKDADPTTIIAAIEATVAGKSILDPDIAGKVLTFVRQGPTPDQSLLADLSPREIDIWQRIAHGATNFEIADELSLAEGTVRNYVSELFSKLGVHDRTRAAALAWQAGIVK